MGLLEVLTIVFVVLKLVGVITWSWWLIFLPLIIAAGIYAIIIVLNVVFLVKTKREIDREFDRFFK